MPHYNTGWRSRCVHLRKRSGRQQRTTRRLDTESPSGAQLAKFFQGDGERAFVHLHRGAKSSVCDWATDLRKDGPRVAAPYGQKAHELARLALLRGWRFNMAIGTAELTT